MVNYYEYIKSAEWKQKADEAKKRAGWRCQICNTAADEAMLTAHHRTYANLGHENPEDLIVLCWDCHTLHHGRNGNTGDLPSPVNLERLLREYDIVPEDELDDYDDEWELYERAKLLARDAASRMGTSKAVDWHYYDGCIKFVTDYLGV